MYDVRKRSNFFARGYPIIPAPYVEKSTSHWIVLALLYFLNFFNFLSYEVFSSSLSQLQIAHKIKHVS